MFEKYLSSIILTLANKYIKNVNASELKLSLWGGAVTLNNVELRTEVLQEELETSLVFKRIFIQELKLNIPWASLRYQPAKIRVRNAEIVLVAGGDEPAAASSAAEGAMAEDAKDDAAQTLDNSQMSWVYSLITQALANLIVDINGVTIRAEMLRRAPAVATGGTITVPEPQRPRQAERRRRCRLSLNGQVVEATPAGFGPTIEVVAAAQSVSGRAVMADPPLADEPLRNVDALRGQIGVVERGCVSFVEKARRLQAAGVAAVVVLNVAEADYVPLAMIGDPGSDIAVPVVCVRRSSAELLKHLTERGESCCATLMLDGMATSGGQRQSDGDATPAGGVGGTPAPKRSPSPVTVQAVLLDDTRQVVPDGITTVTADKLTQDVDVSSIADVTVASSGIGVAESSPDSLDASSFQVHLSDVHSNGSMGIEQENDVKDSQQYVEEPAWTLVLVFDVVKSHSTDTAWRDVQIDAATGDPVDYEAGGSVQEQPSRRLVSTNNASASASFAAQSSGSNPDDSCSHNSSTLHRVVDFSNLVMYVCEENVLDGLDFTLRIKLRKDTTENLHHVDLTIPRVSLSLSQVQARVLRCWYDWFMGTPAVPAAEPQSAENPLYTPAGTPEKKQQTWGGDAVTPASHGADSAAADVSQQAPGWLGWAWGMVAGPEAGRSSGAVPHPSESPPREKPAKSGGKSQGSATDENDLIETVTSNYKASHTVFLMYVIELDVVLRLEHTKHWQQQQQQQQQQLRTPTDNVLARNAALTECDRPQQQGRFAMSRFRELLIDVSKIEGQPVDVVVSSSFADVYALAATVTSGDAVNDSEEMLYASMAAPGRANHANMAAPGLPVIICGQRSEQKQPTFTHCTAESAAGASGLSAAAPDRAAPAYGSLADNDWDEGEVEQDSLSGREPPRPVPPSMPPRSRHDAAAVCVKVVGAHPVVPDSTAQVETRVSQVAHFNVVEFNENIALFCSEMFFDEGEQDDAKEAGNPSETKASASNTRRSSAAHAGPRVGEEATSLTVEGVGGSKVSSLSGDQLVAAVVELANRMKHGSIDEDANDATGHRQDDGGSSAMQKHDIDVMLASSALGEAATGMLTQVEKRALDWTTSELAEVRAERDELKAELQEVRARLQCLEHATI